MTSGKRWGATPEDWDALVEAGQLEYLLPCVSRPGMPLSEKSNLGAIYSKVPTVYNAEGLVAGIGKWTAKRSTAKDIARWKQEPDYGICLQGWDVRGLDIDIDDNPELVEDIRILAEKHLGFVPVRYRNDSSRILMAFRVPGPLPYRVHKIEAGAIELQADKKQFVVAGIHKSGEHYQWEGGTPRSFPLVEREAFEAFWSEMALAFPGVTKVASASRGGQLEEAGEGADDGHVIAFLRDNGWVLDEANGKLHIRCPFEHEHGHESKDSSATTYMPAGTDNYARGHFKCQHDSCIGHNENEGDYYEAIGIYAEEFLPVVVSEEERAVEPPDFVRNPQSGRILSTLSNAMLALRSPHWCGVDLAQDQFRDELMLTPTGKQEWRAFRDADYARLRLQLEHKGLSLGVDLLKEAVCLRADENRFDSAMLWLEQEVPAWDGVPRIESFYPRIFGTKDTPYTRALGLYTWTALAGRVLDPGCKVDMVPILRGPQGLRKSAAVAAMVPSHDFFVELDLSARDDDMSRLMRGKLIAELGELKGLHNREVEAVKAFITRRYEQWVPKYREFATNFPRRLLFIGTTNKHEFLADDTGNRRWLPVECAGVDVGEDKPKADVDAIERDRLQLWAEARELWTAGGVQWQEAERLAGAEHEQYRITDSWEDVVQEWLEEFDDMPGDEEPVRNKDRELRSHDVLVGALRMDPKAIKRGDEMRLGAVMTALGYVNRNRRVNGKQAKRWVKE